MAGWVKTHRKILSSNVFQNEKLFKIFMWCTLKATHKEHEQLIGKQKITLLPGQFIFGRKRASEELNMNESTVKNYIDFLEKEKCIIKKSTNKYSLVTVANWGLYQSEEEKDTNRIPTEYQQNTTNKKG